MVKVYVVVRHFSDSNSLESNSMVCFASCTKSCAEKVVSMLDKICPGCIFEVVETDLI